jgi:hypothetical protein
LELSQFKSAVVHLQTLEDTAQHVIFNKWIDSIRDDVNPEDIETFDEIVKVDIDNGSQLQAMYRNLHRSMEVVFYWTNYAVFPYATNQFPSKRATNAWNLVDSGRAIGFLGTDDNRLLLPLQVRQVDPGEETLRATNGEMIDRILRCTIKVTVLDDGNQVPLWKAVLSSCIANGATALIDVAGLMAGTTSASIYDHLLPELLTNDAIRGLVYFDLKSEEWMIFEKANNRRLPLKSSSITEAECFVYFDQSRCRGCDMELLKRASALVTLEPMLTKDKFLQGCKRMRNLRPEGQSLILAGPPEVVGSETTVKDVLETVLRNTVRMVETGVVAYYQRGVEFWCANQQNSTKVLSYYSMLIYSTA